VSCTAVPLQPDNVIRNQFPAVPAAQHKLSENHSEYLTTAKTDEQAINTKSHCLDDVTLLIKIATNSGGRLPRGAVEGTISRPKFAALRKLMWQKRACLLPRSYSTAEKATAFSFSMTSVSGRGDVATEVSYTRMRLSQEKVMRS
jgi:hypothetical protein